MTREMPSFRDEKEEAEFWDTHNTLDYADGEPVTLEIEPELAGKIAGRQRMKRVTIRLKEHQIEAAKSIAQGKDIPYQTLMRSWIAQAIQREQTRRRASRDSRISLGKYNLRTQEGVRRRINK